MTRLHYATDLTDVQWALLEALLPPPKKTGRKPIDKRWIIDAILYVLRTSCQWRNLPHDFPKWKTVYNNFLKWRNDGTWKRIHDTLVQQVRQAYGKEATPTAGIIDSSSAATSESGGTQRGYDAGKKINGRKRHIVVDPFAWLKKYRRHCKDYERNPDSSVAMIYIAMTKNMLEMLKNKGLRV